MKTLSLKTIAGLCAAASVLSLSAVAVAQDGPSRGGPPPGGPGAHGQQGPEHRTQRLHDLLQITPAQEAAFQAWQAAMKPPARGDRAARRDRPAEGKLTTPERLDQRLALSARRQEQMKIRVDATKRFYGQLTPAQRTAMDSLPMMLADGHRGRGHGGPHRGHGGRRGPGGPGFEQPQGPGRG